MRLIRLAALLVSLVLISATAAALIASRSRKSDELDTRAAMALAVAQAEVTSTIREARALVAATSIVADGAELTPRESEAADPLEVIPGTTYCGVVTDEPCADSGLFRLRSVTNAFGALDDETTSVALVDTDSGAIVVVGNTASTAIVSLPLTSLIQEATDAARDVEVNGEGFPSEVRIELLSESGGELAVVGDLTDDARRTSATLDTLLDNGQQVRIIAAAPGEVGLTGDAALLFAAAFGAGIAFLLLAGWASRVERSKLEQRATTDDLTGLVNRREFERQGNDALIQGERMRSSVCLMLIDLNGFKQINDTLGHRVGDVVLEEVARRLVSAVRDTDVVGRWGGDEFVALLPGLDDGTTVRIIAERIAVAMAQPIETEEAEGTEVTISGSIGAAIYPRHGSNFQQVLSAADEAMYSAKSTGVAYRLADTVPEDADILSGSYVGPDRRRSPSEV